MATRIILSVIGSDRPGLTQTLAEAVLASGGNWLESHLSRLGGTYVGSVLVELDEAQIAVLEDAVRSVDASGLHVSLAPAGGEAQGGGAAMAFELVGQDRPGIVREVTAVLTRLGVNIEDFDTRTEHGAWSGAPMFHASARLTLPAGVSEADVQAALEAISGEIMVDFSIGAGKPA